MACVICRVEAPAAEAACLVSAAGPAHVGSLARLEDVATPFTSSGFSVFGTLDGSLSFAELEGSGRLALGEEKPHVLMLPTSQRPEQVG
jgi:hypothetical protein